MARRSTSTRRCSYGQLFPHRRRALGGHRVGRRLDYAPGFDFTTPDRRPDRAPTCRGATLGETSRASYGTPLYPERIQDGWYQLPGDDRVLRRRLAGLHARRTLGHRRAPAARSARAVYDAAQIADPEIDYNEFDSDKDGVVDFFMMVFVGCGGNGASQVEPVDCEDRPVLRQHLAALVVSLEAQYNDPATGLRGYISDDQLTSLEGVPQCWTTTTYAPVRGLRGQRRHRPRRPAGLRARRPVQRQPRDRLSSRASVISHEYGHHLGLPDFYNTDEQRLRRPEPDGGRLPPAHDDLQQAGARLGRAASSSSPGESRQRRQLGARSRTTPAQIHWQTPDGHAVHALGGQRRPEHPQRPGLRPQAAAAGWSSTRPRSRAGVGAVRLVVGPRQRLRLLADGRPQPRHRPARARDRCPRARRSPSSSSRAGTSSGTATTASS